MDSTLVQPYVERAEKAEELIVQLQKQLATLESLVQSRKNEEVSKKTEGFKNNEQSKEVDEKTQDKARKIEAFLAHRPTPKQLGINLRIASTLHETVRHLERKHRRDSIHHFIGVRPTADELKAAGIFKYPEIAPSLQATSHTLEKEIIKDKLERKVENRPSPEAVGVNLSLSPTIAQASYKLEKQQLKDKFAAAFNKTGGIHAYSHDTNIAPYSNITPSLQPTAAKLEHHHRRDSMDKLLQSCFHKGTEKQNTNTNDTCETHNVKIGASEIVTTSFLIEHLKHIREDVVKMEMEKQYLQDAIAYRDLLLRDSRRSLHWCIKVGNLKKSLEFFCDVFGMKVLRHEEFSSQCDAKCNGDYNNPWSKTMISFNDEHTNFALELTYTYGIKGYRRGNDLRYIGIYIVEESLQKAEKQGYKTKKIENDTNLIYEIIGPDDVCIHAQIVKELPKEPFWSIALNVKDISQTYDYWVGTLNLHPLAFVNNAYLRCCYGYQVPMEFYQLKNDEQLDHGKAQGRIAYSTCLINGHAILYNYIFDRGYKVHTEPVTLSTPGKADVTVIILQDPDEYEICFVGQKGFDDLCTTKSGDENIDWKYRQDNGADQDKGKIDE